MDYKYMSRNCAHLLRNKFDCIISTSKSINKDNSLLNCRINGLDNNKPDFFIIDLNLRLKKIIIKQFNQKEKTYLITTKNAEKSKNLNIRL